MKSRILLVIIMCASSFTGFTQIGIGTISPDASSVLDMTSTTQGVLIPRMTTIQREAIAGPVLGLQVYDTDSKSVWSYNGAVWTNGTGGPGKFVDGATTNIAYYDGKVGIGLNNFSDAHKLYVDGIKSTDGTNTATRINASYTGASTSMATTAVGAVTSNVGSGTIDFASANRGIINNSATGTINSAWSSWHSVENLGSIADASGLLSAVNNYGNITRGYSQNVNIYNDTGSLIDDARVSYMYLFNFGTMTQGYGLSIDYFGSGTIVDSYALHISSNFNKGTGENFAIYSASDADSYLEGKLAVNSDLNVEGNIGVGIATPLQKVHISGAMRLEPQATPPTGTLGDLYVDANGNLYFNDGTVGTTGWRPVLLGPAVP